MKAVFVVLHALKRKQLECQHQNWKTLHGKYSLRSKVKVTELSSVVKAVCRSIRLHIFLLRPNYNFNTNLMKLFTDYL